MRRKAPLACMTSAWSGSTPMRPRRWPSPPMAGAPSSNPAGRSAAEHRSQPPRALVQRGVGLGEAEADDRGLGLFLVEGRDGDGGDAGFAHGLQAEVAVR